MPTYTEALDAKDAEAFIAKQTGDQIIGHVVDTDSYAGKFGADTVVLTIETVNGESVEDGTPIPAGELRKLFAFGEVLAGEVAKKQPDIGDLIGARFNGLASKAKEGQSPAKLWKLVVFERAGGASRPSAVEQAAALNAVSADEAGL